MLPWMALCGRWCSLHWDMACVCQGSVCNTDERGSAPAVGNRVLCLAKGTFVGFPHHGELYWKLQWAQCRSHTDFAASSLEAVHPQRCKDFSVWCWVPSSVSLVSEDWTVGLFTVLTFCLICVQEIMHLAFGFLLRSHRITIFLFPWLFSIFEKCT